MQEQEGKAEFVLSLDCELLWGSHAAGGIDRFPYLAKGFEQYYAQILGLFEKYQVRATFAFVGAMALGIDDFANLPMNGLGEAYQGWHRFLVAYARRDPCLWFNPGLIEAVRNSALSHEIASHSLTHIRFDDPRLDPVSARFEFEASRAILADNGKSNVRTFIFPENRISHLDILRDTAYKVYRSKDDAWYRTFPIKSAFHFLDQALPIPSRGVTPGLDPVSRKTTLPGSLLLFAYDGIRGAIPDWIRIRKIKAGIERAIADQKTFHLWFHPWNLGSSTRMSYVLESVLDFVAIKRTAGELRISTLGDLA